MTGGARKIVRLREPHASLVREPGIHGAQRPVATGAADVAPLLARFAERGAGRRRLVVASVNARDRVLGVTRVPAACTLADVRAVDVFRPLLAVGAVRFYLGCCDASRAPRPSEPELVLARRLAELGAVLGVELSDMLILGAAGVYHSLREHGQAVAAWRDEAHERALRADPRRGRRAARVRAARNRRHPAPSLTRAASLRAALWTCGRCHRRQTQRALVCRYCQAARTVH